MVLDTSGEKLEFLNFSEIRGFFHMVLPYETIDTLDSLLVDKFYSEVKKFIFYTSSVPMSRCSFAQFEIN